MGYFNGKKRSVYGLFILITSMFILASYTGCSSSSSSKGSEDPYVEDDDNNPDQAVGVYDIIIKNGRVIDSETGRDEIATVGLIGGVIKLITTESDADLILADDGKVIDASGLIVSPGFVNTHTHEGNGVFNNQITESSQAYVQDGITFWLGGNCGLSPTGVEIQFGDNIISNKTGLTLPEFLEKTEKEGLYNNYGTLSGNITLRGEVGCVHGEAETSEQIAKMVELLEDDLEVGSFGVSYGAFYDPGTSKKSMIALAKASREVGGMAASHIRDVIFDLKGALANADGSLPVMDFIADLLFKNQQILFKDSLYEAIDTCRQTDIPYIVSHLTDMTYLGATEWSLDTISNAITDEGLPLAADIIGYDTFSNDFYALTRFGEIPVSLLLFFAGASPDQFFMAEDVFINGELYLAEYERVQNLSQITTLVDAFNESRLNK